MNLQGMSNWGRGKRTDGLTPLPGSGDKRGCGPTLPGIDTREGGTVGAFERGTGARNTEIFCGDCLSTQTMKEGNRRSMVDTD